MKKALVHPGDSFLLDFRFDVSVEESREYDVIAHDRWDGDGGDVAVETTMVRSPTPHTH